MGHSLHAPVGRWQKGKDILWYEKKGSSSSNVNDELRLRKQRDEEMMNEALGLAPKRLKQPSNSLDQEDMKRLLQRGATERDLGDIERVEGLGAAPAVGHAHIAKKTLAERYKERHGDEDEGVYRLGDKDEKKRLKKEKKRAKKEKKKRKRKRDDS